MTVHWYPPRDFLLVLFFSLQLALGRVRRYGCPLPSIHPWCIVIQ